MPLLMRELSRRGVAVLAAAVGAGILVRTGGGIMPAANAADEKKERGPREGEDVSATEDLMREHGVLRRTLIVYAEVSSRLPLSHGPRIGSRRSNTGATPSGTLQATITPQANVLSLLSGSYADTLTITITPQ
jgi:hypothetical protein